MRKQFYLGLGLGVAVIAILAIAVSLRAGPSASAATGTIRIGDITVGASGQGKILLSALDVGEPGLGAWVIDVEYDAAIISPNGCTASAGGFCNMTFGPHTIRVVGANAGGLTGDTMLASLSFHCEQGGSSGVNANIRELADATQDDPQPIDAAVDNGGVVCTAPGPTPTPSQQSLGDVNCDGRVNSVDALLILQLRAGLIDSVPCPQNADVDGDGDIDAIDALLILQADAGLIDL